VFTVSLQLAGVDGGDEGVGSSDLSCSSLLVAPQVFKLRAKIKRAGGRAGSVGRSLGRLAVDVWLLLKLKISIPIRTPGFIEAQFVSLLQDNTHSSRGQ